MSLVLKMNIFNSLSGNYNIFGIFLLIFLQKNQIKSNSITF